MDCIKACLCMVLLAAVWGDDKPNQQDPKYRPFWPIPDVDYDAKAQEELDEALKYQWNTNAAKNVILFLGDGMGLPTIFAARIYKGQTESNGEKSGEETKLAWETFPHVALSKTYNHNHQVPDSAGTATSYLCGKKVNFGTIGVSYKATRGKCETQPGTKIYSIAKWTTAAGKASGVVTTTRLTHATPAATYGHVAERYWEGDSSQTPSERENCPDLARQLVEENHEFNVFLGGGRKNFMSETSVDPEYPEKNGTRVDGRDLFTEWEKKKADNGDTYKYVWNKADFEAVDPATTDFLLGSFEYDNMQYEADREKDKGGEPHIKDMTGKAIDILSKNDKGFFLLVEGGRIDHAHHDSLAHHALVDTLAFEAAIKVALEKTSPEDTLIIVTADHSHTFTVGGYPSRGNDILGFVDAAARSVEPPKDDKPYLSMNYANGPGSAIHLPRADLSHMGKDDLHDFKFVQPGLVPTKFETHGGEDVAIYALGPMAHLFHSTHEQNYIAHVMAFASCVGDHKKRCDVTVQTAVTCGAATGHVSVLLTIVTVAMTVLRFLH